MRKLMLRILVPSVFLWFGCGGSPAPSSPQDESSCPASVVCCPSGGHCTEGQTCFGNYCVDPGNVGCTDSSGEPNGTECPSARGCCTFGCCL